MSDPTKAHAKTRPPSSAKRWINCPNSAHIMTLYPHEETEASLKGDMWHQCMEDTIRFGFVPPYAEPDMADAMQDLLDYVNKRIAEKGETPIVLVEVKLDIPLTGEFGTCDILLVWSDEIEVLDHKSGYVPVDVLNNDQMLCYLTGAIAKYGERPKYRLSIHQPNFDHKDGPMRHHDITETQVALFEIDVLASLQNENCVVAGPWCKDTYCQHRGACEAFKVYAKDDLSLGWHTTEYKAMDDVELAKALDASEELAGYRTALRAEAMRRIMNTGRKIPGYKVVKGRKQRAILKPRELVTAVHLQMGLEWAVKLFPSLAWAGTNIPVANEEVLKCLGTAKHVEDVIKQYAKEHKLPRGGWKSVYDNVVGEYIRETANGLELDKEIGGRPEHRRGSEFGSLGTPQANQTGTSPITLL